MRVTLPYKRENLRSRHRVDGQIVNVYFPLLRGALLSKLGTIFKMANSPPRITARRGGGAIKKISRSIRFSRRRGGVPIDGTRNTTPAASIKRLRAIFLVTPPPLLAVMRGGEFVLFKMRPPTTYRCLGRAGRASQRLLQPDSSEEGKHLVPIRSHA